MCKACDGPPYEKAKYQFPRTDDWEDPRHAHHPRKTKQRKDKHPTKGCPGNDHGAHVYVIVEVISRVPRYRFHGDTKSWERYTSDVTHYRRECIGCGKVTKTYYYWNKNSPVGRDFNESDIYMKIDERKKPWSLAQL